MGKIVQFFKNRGLVGKMSWAISLILVIPVTVICLFYYSAYQKSLLNDAKKRLSEDLISVENAMNTNLDTVETVIEGLEYRQEFQYFLDDKNELSEAEINYYVSSVQNEMLDIRRIYPNYFYQIIIHSSNIQAQKKDLAKDWQVELKTVKQADYYNEIEQIQIKDSPGVGNIYSSSEIAYGRVREAGFSMSEEINQKLKAKKVIEVGTPVLPAYKKIYNITSKELVGLIEVNIEVSKLIAADTIHTEDQKVDYLLFGQDHQLIYGNEMYQTKELKGGFFKDKKGSVDVKIGEKTYMIDYNTCEKTGLIRAVAMSKDEVLQDASQMIRNVVILAVLGVGLIMILSYWLMKQMLKRLLVLDGMMGEIEEGNFNVVIEEGDSDDEVTRIERSFNKMASHLQTVINTTVEKEKSRRDAELRALQAQINPHFLYNTLENMKMQCEIEGYEDISDSLTALGDLLRYSVKWGNHEVPLEMEWNHLKNYVSLMKMRFDEQLKCILECEEDLGEIIVPKMILQPLVENSFEHGFQKIMPPWLLMIRIYRERNYLLIRIEDNGKGMEKKRLKEIQECLEETKPLKSRKKPGTSIGVVNVKQRIDMICPEGSTMTIDSHPGQGSRVEVKIILEES